MDRGREEYTAQREADGGLRRPEPDLEEEAIPVREDEPDLVQKTEVHVGRGLIRWGPIWAGLLAALASFLLLSVLALAIGAQTVDAVGAAETVATVTGWATAIIGLIAFFVGGWVAGATSAVRGTVAGLLSGFLVWALGTVLILAFSALGVGQLFGALGDLFTQFRVLVVIPESDPQVVQLIADAIASTAFVAFLSMLLPAIAATLGGWLGAKTAPREGNASANTQTPRRR
ncbi:MAG: permease [Actinomycetota bacterium]|nr:permease [Actinomycetota bacterium]